MLGQHAKVALVTRFERNCAIENGGGFAIPSYLLPDTNNTTNLPNFERHCSIDAEYGITESHRFVELS